MPRVPRAAIREARVDRADPRQIEALLRVRIDELLAARHMNRMILSKKMGVTPSYVTNVMNGRKALTLTFLIAVCEVLEADLDIVPELE